MCPREGELAQVGGGILVVAAGGGDPEALGNRDLREPSRAELDLDIAALAHLLGAVAGLRDLGEELAHLRGGLQVVLRAVELEPLLVRQGGTGLDAEQGVVGLVVLALGVVRVVGGHQRGTDLLGQPD